MKKITPGSWQELLLCVAAVIVAVGWTASVVAQLTLMKDTCP